MMNGEELREFREKTLKLTSLEFAKAIGVKENNEGSQVRGWERGYRAIPGPVQTILSLCQEEPGVIDWIKKRSGCFVDPETEEAPPRSDL
jgi:DNA-binding transcriptional regulator YiaG